MSSTKLCEIVVEGMREKKAENVVVLDLNGVKNAVASYFVICTGNSDTQVDSISDSVEELVYKNLQQEPWHKEGYQNKEWILIDFVDVVAHIFKKEIREFYSLEDLWGDAVVNHITP
ncbi:MAG: ribosome silencing factor [Cytophagales bacterium]|nr:ribosome silencing factor [Cytophagales bacterium]